MDKRGLKGRKVAAVLEIGGKENKETHRVFEGINSIGRSPNATVIIKSPNVSQEQAIITIIDGKHYISEYCSSNGTYLGNEKLQMKNMYEITDGANLKFANVSAVYKIIVDGIEPTCDDTDGNLTESFYGRQTQCFDDSILNASEIATQRSGEMTQLVNIHEMATQQIDFGGPVTTPNKNNKAEDQDKILTVTADIHEMPTQLLCDGVAAEIQISTSEEGTQPVENVGSPDNLSNQSLDFMPMILEEARKNSEEVESDEELHTSQLTKKNCRRLQLDSQEPQGEGSSINKSLEIAKLTSTKISSDSETDDELLNTDSPQKKLTGTDQTELDSDEKLHRSQLQRTVSNVLNVNDSSESDDSFLKATHTSVNTQNLVVNDTVEGGQSDSSALFGLTLNETDEIPATQFENFCRTFRTQDVVRKAKDVSENRGTVKNPVSQNTGNSENSFNLELSQFISEPSEKPPAVDENNPITLEEDKSSLHQTDHTQNLLDEKKDTDKLKKGSNKSPTPQIESSTPIRNEKRRNSVTQASSSEIESQLEILFPSQTIKATEIDHSRPSNPLADVLEEDDRLSESVFAETTRLQSVIEENDPFTPEAHFDDIPVEYNTHSIEAGEAKASKCSETDKKAPKEETTTSNSMATQIIDSEHTEEQAIIADPEVDQVDVKDNLKSVDEKEKSVEESKIKSHTEQLTSDEKEKPIEVENTNHENSITSPDSENKSHTEQEVDEKEKSTEVENSKRENSESSENKSHIEQETSVLDSRKTVQSKDPHIFTSTPHMEKRSTRARFGSIQSAADLKQTVDNTPTSVKEVKKTKIVTRGKKKAPDTKQTDSPKQKAGGSKIGNQKNESSQNNVNSNDTRATRKRQLDENKEAETMTKKKRNDSKATITAKDFAEKVTVAVRKPKKAEPTNNNINNTAPTRVLRRRNVSPIEIISVSSSCSEAGSTSSKTHSTRRTASKVDKQKKQTSAPEETTSVNAMETTGKSKISAPKRLTSISDNHSKGSQNNIVQSTSLCTTRTNGNTVPDTSVPLKKRKLDLDSTSVLSSPDRSKRKTKPKIVFTMLDDPSLEGIIRNLGGSIVDSVDAATVLVTGSVKRTQKLLAAVGQGKPICSPAWLKECKKANSFLDPWDFILKDEEAEKKWKFSLQESLRRSSEKKILEDYHVQIVVDGPVKDVLKTAVEICGGKCVTRAPPKNAQANFLVVVTPENRSKYNRFLKQVPQPMIVAAEAILDGALRQELHLEDHRIQ